MLPQIDLADKLKFGSKPWRRYLIKSCICYRQIKNTLYCLHDVIKAITNLGLLIQFFADKLMDHDDVIDYKLLPIEFDIAYDFNHVIILLSH